MRAYAHTKTENHVLEIGIQKLIELRLTVLINDDKMNEKITLRLIMEFSAYLSN